MEQCQPAVAPGDPVSVTGPDKRDSQVVRITRFISREARDRAGQTRFLSDTELIGLYPARYIGALYDLRHLAGQLP